jgi:hypothetical protein
MTTGDLTQVVQLQMARFDPPGTTYIPGLRENLYGKFTINVGVFVPEVHDLVGVGVPKSLIREVDCCIRSRIGTLAPEGRDIWWQIRADRELVEDLWKRLDRDAFPFFKRFETRDAILEELLPATRPRHIGSYPPRIVCAIILAKRGVMADARALLAAQAEETAHPQHSSYVKELAERMGLGGLD